MNELKQLSCIAALTKNAGSVCPKPSITSGCRCILGSSGSKSSVSMFWYLSQALPTIKLVPAPLQI
jgi:hypothetical protein